MALPLRFSNDTASCGFDVFRTRSFPSLSLLSGRSVTRSYYRNSVGGLLVFDLTNRASFEHVLQWHAEVCERVKPHAVLFVLVGHKSDCDDAQGQREVGRPEAEKLAAQLGVPYVEASAKSGARVAEAFELLTRSVYRGMLSGEVQLREGWDGVKSSSTQKLSPQSCPPDKSSKKCC